MTGPSSLGEPLYFYHFKAAPLSHARCSFAAVIFRHSQLIVILFTDILAILARPLVRTSALFALLLCLWIRAHIYFNFVLLCYFAIAIATAQKTGKTGKIGKPPPISALNALFSSLGAPLSRVFAFFHISSFFWSLGPKLFHFVFYLLGLRTIKPAKCFWPRQGDDVDIEDPRENTLFNFKHIFPVRNSLEGVRHDSQDFLA